MAEDVRKGKSLGFAKVSGPGKFLPMLAQSCFGKLGEGACLAVGQAVRRPDLNANMSQFAILKAVVTFLFARR